MNGSAQFLTHTLIALAAVLPTLGRDCVRASEGMSVETTQSTITVSSDGVALLVYNKRTPKIPAGIDPIYARSGFLHPVHTPAGRVVTAAFPHDHPHQQGIFSAWVKTDYAGRSPDFWNAAAGTGRVFHERVVSTFQDQGQAGFEVDLIHQAARQPAIDVLRERWKVTAYATDGNYRCFDLHTIQSALTDQPLTVRKYHYGGMALRGPVEWLLKGDTDSKKGGVTDRELSGFLNDLKSSRIKGNHQPAKWVSLWGKIDGNSVSITVLSAKDNFRAPQPARLHPRKPYFCFCPCVASAFVIDRDHPFEARYRYLVTDTAPDPQWLDEQWDRWMDH